MSSFGIILCETINDDGGSFLYLCEAFCCKSLLNYHKFALKVFLKMDGAVTEPMRLFHCYLDKFSQVCVSSRHQSHSAYEFSSYAYML